MGGLTFPLWSPAIGDIQPGVINSLLGSDAIVNTTISTVGNGTLTGVALIGGQISRTGPTAAFTDTTDTATGILIADGGDLTVGDSFVTRIKNITAFPMTISGGTGVTWSAVAVIPPFSVGYYFGTFGGSQASPTIAFSHINTGPAWNSPSAVNPETVALTTVGAGTITATGIAAGVTLRSGATSAFSDTTDTADAIIAAAMSSVASIGAAFYYTYVNNSVAVATIGGGTGVTVSGATVIQPNSWVTYLVTNTAASTVTMIATGQGYFPKNGTFVANQATPVTVADTRVTASSQIDITLKTVGGTVDVARPNVVTITPGTGFNVVAAAADTSTYNYSIRG